MVIIMEKIKVLFICMGNICRSPTAEGVFSKLVSDNNLKHLFTIDSAGTHAYHTGEAPDLRAQRAAAGRDVHLHHLKARRVTMRDFEDFDFLLAMDEDNYDNLIASCPDEYKHKVQLFLSYAPQLSVRDVPDPYYGGLHGFERVLDLIEIASEGFLTSLQTTGRIGK